MNVTPLIDILLVLLIIFMVITPLKQSGEYALVPQPAPNQKPMESTVVVQVLANGSSLAKLKINQEDVSWENLGTRLQTIFASRAERVLFVRGEQDLTFEDVAQVIGIAHTAGIQRVGLITQKLEAGG